MSSVKLLKSWYYCPFLESRVDVLCKDGNCRCLRAVDWRTGKECPMRGSKVCIESMVTKEEEKIEAEC